MVGSQPHVGHTNVELIIINGWIACDKCCSSWRKKKLNRKKRFPTEYPNAFGEPLKGGMIIIIFVLCFLVAIDHVYWTLNEHNKLTTNSFTESYTKKHTHKSNFTSLFFPFVRIRHSRLFTFREPLWNSDKRSIR